MAQSSRNFLEMAKSYLGQSASELRALNEQKASELEVRWIETHEKCRVFINSELEHFLHQELKPSEKRVIKINDSEYHLPCAVCGDIAVMIELGIREYDQEEGVIYSGIVVGTHISAKYAE